MSLRTNFVCEKCGKKMTWWEIFKLSLGYQGETKKFECICGNSLKFKINFLWIIPFILVAIAIVEFPKIPFFIIISLVLVLLSLFLYFANIKKIGEEFHKPV